MSGGYPLSSGVDARAGRWADEADQCVLKRDRIKVDANESFRVNGTEVRIEGFDGKWLYLAWEAR